MVDADANHPLRGSFPSWPPTGRMTSHLSFGETKPGSYLAFAHGSTDQWQRSTPPTPTPAPLVGWLQIQKATGVNSRSCHRADPGAVRSGGSELQPYSAGEAAAAAGATFALRQTLVFCTVGTL